MHATTNCRIIFSGQLTKLEDVMDYLERTQRGEYYLDDDTENLVLNIEEDIAVSDKDTVIALIDKLYKRFKRAVNIHASGTFNAIESDSTQRFECQYTKNFFRYRESEWSDINDNIDATLSYEEFEEEYCVDVDEDEYEESRHRAHDGIRQHSDNIWGDWDYID